MTKKTIKVDIKEAQPKSTKKINPKFGVPTLSKPMKKTAVEIDMVKRKK